MQGDHECEAGGADAVHGLENGSDTTVQQQPEQHGGPGAQRDHLPRAAREAPECGP